MLTDKQPHKLPRSIRLGAIEVVKIKLITQEFMKTVSPGGTEEDGLWDPANKLVYVIKTLSLDNQWEILRHELLHAIIDIDHEVRIEGPTTAPVADASVPSEVPVVP